MARHLLALAVGTLLVAMPACTSVGTGRRTAVAVTASSPGGTVSARDRAWLVTAHQANLAEIQVGRMAAKKGGSRAIRQTGAMLVTDHTKFDTEVTDVARRLGVELPGSASADDIAAAQRLDKESGVRFDRDFVTTMIAGHRNVIALTEAEVRQGSSADVTALARSALPTLHRHLAVLEKASPTS
jgi:putative membrane protein